jgi:hypothetical protein
LIELFGLIGSAPGTVKAREPPAQFDELELLRQDVCLLPVRSGQQILFGFGVIFSGVARRWYHG